MPLTATDNQRELAVRDEVHDCTRRTTKDRPITVILKKLARTKDRLLMASATYELVGTSTLKVAMQPPLFRRCERNDEDMNAM